MEIKAQVTKWVEKKIGRIIDEDLKVKIENEYSQFDVQTYVNSLEDKYFNEGEIDNLKNTLNSDFQSVANDFDSYDSDEEINSKDFLEFANNEFQTFSIDETVKNLENDSEDIRMQSLQALEVYAEEIINHSSWIVVQKILLKILKDRRDKKMHNLVLKVFFKFLTSTNKPQIIGEVFMSMSKVLTSLIKDGNVAFEEIYDLRGNVLLHKQSFLSNAVNDHFQRFQKSTSLEVPIILMWLLIYCQQRMPEKWVRFNEKRLREIIFPFVHLLSSTSIVQTKNVTALELLSILNPSASWCRSWCHTAVGRNVLCSALRKYKTLFIHMIEIILNKIKTAGVRQLLSVRSNEVTSKNYSIQVNGHLRYFPKKTIDNEYYLKERTKHIRSAPVDVAKSDRHLIFWRIKKNSKWLTERIPKGVVTEAMFWHSVSVALCLIQFRCGQALFPIQIGTRKRPLSAQDLTLSLTEYLENLDYNESGDEEFDFSVAYKAEVLKKIQTLKNIRNNILSSRMKMERSSNSTQLNFQNFSF